MNAREIIGRLLGAGGHRFASRLPGKSKRWDELGGALVGVHLCAATNPGVLVGHTKPKRKLHRRRSR